MAVVLARLTRAATSNRSYPRWFRPAGLLGAALLLAVPLGAIGSTDTGDLGAISGRGFLVWIVLLVTSGRVKLMTAALADEYACGPAPATSRVIRP